MGQLTITLSDELENKVRKHSQENRYDSVSDFAREALEKASSQRPTYWERTILVSLMEIKQGLGLEISEEILDALRDGYYEHYSTINSLITRNEMPNEDIEFVRNVLKMYDELQYSYSQSKQKDSSIEADLIFPGFDGNADDGHIHYLSFLIKHGYYTTVKPLDKGSAINAHGKVTDIYERMLSKYNEFERELSNRKLLTLDQIRSIIKERIHPENR